MPIMVASQRSVLGPAGQPHGKDRCAHRPLGQNFGGADWASHPGQVPPVTIDHSAKPQIMQQIFPGRQSRLDSSESAGLERAVVLDTNVVLDLLVFADPRCEGLGLSLACHPLRWHATQAMRAEFEAVLARPKFAWFAAQRERAMTGWHGWARMVEPLALASPRLQCRDRDDQMFLDLAWQLSPCSLLTRDHQVLRLSRPAAGLGVHIATPEQHCAVMKKGGLADRPSL